MIEGQKSVVTDTPTRRVTISWGEQPQEFPWTVYYRDPTTGVITASKQYRDRVQKEVTEAAAEFHKLFGEN